MKTSIPAFALAGIVMIASVGCEPPKELPRLKKPNGPRQVVLMEDRSLGGGTTWSSGITFGSGMTFGSGVTSGSGITMGSGITYGSGITLGSGVTYGSGIRLGSGVTEGGGITLGSGTTQGGGIRLGSGTTYGSGIRLGSGVTGGRGITLSQEKVVVAPKPARKPQTNILVIPETGSGRSGALFDMLQQRRQAMNKDKVSLGQVDYDGLQRVLGEQKGKVVVLDMWSTACLPCMREFPNLVALSKTNTADLACISLNIDYTGAKTKSPQYYAPKVRDFLERERASTTINLQSTVPDEDMSAKFEVYSIPAILIFDREGKLVHNLGEHNAVKDGLSYERDVLPKLKVLLQK
ncbi:MAG: thioredoxin-like domain-containing protein [Planctomycetota bacterium]|nr:thioredoxin-like domain-containing protein [Planctomycetota bacterium]